MPAASPAAHGGRRGKKKYSPAVQLKRLNWTKVQTRALKSDTFWTTCKEEAFESESLFNRLQLLFAARAAKRQTNVIQKSDAVKKVKELKVLDPKSAQNLSILLGSLKTSNESMKKLIVECSAELDASFLSSLLKYLPPPDQLKQLTQLHNSYDQLSDPEKFCCVIGQISRLEKRLSAMLTRLGFREEINDVVPDVDAVISATKELRCKHFGHVLELVLLIGNYMNAGSRNQQSYGFELNFLSKLSNTKSTENPGMTMMHFLAEVIETDHPNLLEIKDNLPNIPRASKLSEEAITKAIIQLQKSVNQVQDELEHHKEPKGNEFFVSMDEFVKSAQHELDSLTSRQQQMQEQCQSLAAYYCIDLKKQPIEELFTDVCVFLEHFQIARKENQKRRELEEKRRKAKERELEREKEKSKRRSQQINKQSSQLVDINGEGDQEGVLDGLMEALNTGTAFNKDQRRRRRQQVQESQSRISATEQLLLS